MWSVIKMKFIRETFFNIICKNKFPYSRILIAKFDSLYFFLLMMENAYRVNETL